MRGKIDEIPLILFKLITTKNGAGKGKSERGEGEWLYYIGGELD